MPRASSRHPAQTAGSGNAAAPAETAPDAAQAVQADPAAATAAGGAQSAAPAEETEEVSAAHQLFPELETSAVTSAKDLTKRQKSYIQSWETLHGREFPMGAPLHNYNWKYLEYDENGILHYEGDDDYTVRRGIDVSEFQGWIDWDAVREAGYDFAFVRVGYRMFDSGDLYEDSRAVKNLKRAKKAGLDVGVYVFSQAVSKKEAREEAKLCLDVIEKSGVEITLPVVFDPEIQIDYYARINYITSEQFTDNAIAFCEAIHKAGRVPAIYANSSTLTDILNMKRITKETDAVIWYADYYGVPETPYQFTFWQYTDLGWVSGIAETETDLNLWFVKNEEEEEAPAEEASDQAAEGASAPAKDAAEASSGKADQTEEKAGAADQTEDKAGAADQTKEGTADQAPSAESAQPAGTP
jgi:GH25 family lysozyme M1 (1,4-beta-N-acetylmuramidase)